MTIYLVRHGVTEWNLEHRIQGLNDIPLHEEGKKQAHVLGKKLIKDGEYSIVFSSPLLRAFETAKIIGDYLKIPLVTNPLLREIDFGKWDGKKLESFSGEEKKAFEQWRKNPALISPPAGETVFEVQQRLQTFLQKSKLHSYPQPVIIVCHQIVGAVLTCTLKNEDLSLMPQYYMKNTDFRIISKGSATILREK